jgi:hypothetical protein
MKKGLITLTLAFAGIFFWGCEKQEEATPKTVSAISEQNTEEYYEKKCCVRTQGYWKNHCEDDTWALIGGCDAYFCGSRLTYLQVLNTATKGDAYFILAHQYIAAKLNLAYCGDDDCEDIPHYVRKIVEEKAKDFFHNHHPGYKCTDQEREELIKWAEILDKFNNGYYGPEHCDEQE